MARPGKVYVLAVAFTGSLTLNAFGGSREIERDFPHSFFCPVHRGTASEAPDDPNAGLKFKAARRSALINFVACDNRSHPEDFQVQSYDVFLDDVTVVREDVFNNPANRDTNGPFFGCDTADPPNQSIFDPPTALPLSQVPLRAGFDGGNADGWLLGNAEVDFSDQYGHYLVMARQRRGPDDTQGLLCSSAAVKVTNLTPGQTYVIDFKWWVSPEFPTEGFPVLTVFLGPEAP